MNAAVVGLGRMGRRHVAVLQGLGINVIGAYDPDLQAQNAAKKECSLVDSQLFSDVDSLFAKTRPEFVVVSTTSTTHCSYTCTAARAGARFILCEKPMAVSLAECDQMLAVCKSTGTQLAINHQMRFMEQYTLPCQMLESPEFGGITSISVVSGNFGLAMNASHYFEMFRFMTAEEPVEVCAWFSNEKVPNPRGPQFEDRAGSVRLVSKSGKRFYLDCSADQGHGMRVIYAARYGQIFVDELAGHMLASVREGAYRELPTTRYGMPASEISQKIKPADSLSPTRAVVQALLSGTNPPTGQDGRTAVATLVAAYASHERGNVSVKLDSGLPLERIFPWA